jgi:hypothetical protein
MSQSTDKTLQKHLEILGKLLTAKQRLKRGMGFADNKR